MISLRDTAKANEGRLPEKTQVIFQLDSHLIFNALNDLVMQVFLLTGREMPLVGKLSDYLTAEYQAGLQVTLPRGKMHSLRNEWEIARSHLALQLNLSGLEGRLHASGPLDEIVLEQHSLVRVIQLVVRQWLARTSGDLQITLDARRTGGLHVLGVMKGAPSSSPFVAETLAAAAATGADHPAARCEAVHDTGGAWELVYRLPAS